MEKLKNKYVLIVDDDRRSNFALGSYLQSLEMVVEVATDGQQAFERLKNGARPDIILLDMEMPVIDGMGALKILQQSPLLKTIPVIAVTGRALKGDMEKCLQAGAWDYLPKPVDVRSLIEKLNLWIA
jgi:CheY-like chemotaxis protein